MFFGAALLLNACSSPTPPAGSTTAKEKVHKAYTIEIRNMKFVPDSITVEKGDEVVFINRDMVTHCVTEENSGAWTSSALPAGATYSHIARESANYFCAIHKVMKGKITVNDR